MDERREETPTVPRSGEMVATKLRRIAGKARKEPKFQFTSLFHLMNEELLRGCFERLRKDNLNFVDVDKICRFTLSHIRLNCPAGGTF